MRSPKVWVPSSFWIRKLAPGFPVITWIRVASRGLATLIRLAALNPGSNRKPCCTVTPPWQPDTAQFTEKTLA